MGLSIGKAIISERWRRLEGGSSHNNSGCKVQRLFQLLTFIEMRYDDISIFYLRSCEIVISLNASS